jgi:hypothetical protein
MSKITSSQFAFLDPAHPDNICKLTLTREIRPDHIWIRGNLQRNRNRIILDPIRIGPDSYSTRIQLPFAEVKDLYIIDSGPEQPDGLQVEHYGESIVPQSTRQLNYGVNWINFIILIIIIFVLLGVSYYLLR